MPCPVRAMVVTQGTPSLSRSRGRSRRLPLCVNSSYMLSTHTTGLPIVRNCMVSSRLRSRLFTSITLSTTSTLPFANSCITYASSGLKEWSE